MTRARCVLGDEALQSRFDAVRNAVIATEREHASLRSEIVDMRAKVRTAHPAKDGAGSAPFDVKHSPGGMVDVEFVVQFLVLSQGARHPELLANVGNIALLLRAQACGLLPAPLGENAAQAYRSLRQVQHRARLNEEPTQVEVAQVVAERAAGIALWSHVFG
jgi:glutamate-ammonia-ligase adenylyltransferase